MATLQAKVYNALTRLDNSRIGRWLKMKTLAIICAAIGVILLSIGSAIPNVHIAYAAGVLIAAAVLFWFMANKDNDSSK